MGEEYYGRNAENIIIIAETTDDITINVADSGTENATTKYLNKGSLATGLIVRPSDVVGLVQLGSKVYRNPITISTAGLSWTRNIKDFNVVVLRPSVASITIEIQVL